MNIIFIYLTALLGAFPILKLNHFNILMILWGMVAVINAYNNDTFRIENKKYLFLFGIPVINLLYFPFANDMQEMSKILQHSVYFIIFPLGILINKNEFVRQKTVHKFSLIYILSTIAVNTLGWIGIFRNDFMDLMSKNDFYHPVFRNIFSEYTNIHLPYLGMLSSFAAILMLNNLLNKKRVFFNMLGIFFLLCSIYIYSARMALLSFGLTAIYLIWNKIKNTKLKYTLFLSISALFGLVLIFSPIKERYINSLNKQWVLPHSGQQPHEVNYRYGIAYCSWQIIKEHWLFGVGADNSQTALNDCYSNFTYQSYEDFKNVSYNSHNQFVDYIIKFGIFGGFFLLLTVFYYYRQSPLVYQSFIMIVFFSMFTENILNRQMGAVFYALINVVFLIGCSTKKEAL